MSEYTAEEYREVLNKIRDMPSYVREAVFGKNRNTLDYIFYDSAQEIIEKYRVYKDSPKTGEYWKRKEDGEMVVVRRVKDGMVFIYYCDGGCANSHSLECFVSNFTRTEYKSEYLGLLIEEMEGVSGTE